MNRIKLGKKGLSVLPDELENQEQKEQIISIEIEYNKITRLESFSCFPTLKVLELSNCCLQQIFLNPNFKLKGLINLAALGLQNNQIETLYQDVFDGCPNLNVLDVSQNNLNTKIRGLRKLSSLLNLDLSYNKIDCVANLMVLKGYLKNMNQIIIKENPLEINTMDKTQLNILKEWFPSLKQLDCKFSCLKYSNQTEELFSRNNSQNNDSSEQEQKENKNLFCFETPKKQVSKIFSQLNEFLDSCSPQLNMKQEEIKSQINLPVSPVKYLLMNEQSIIHEEEIEQSFLSNKKDVIELVQTINQPQQNSSQQSRYSSRKRNKIISEDGGSTSPGKKLQRFLQNGTIEDEIQRLEKIVIQKEKELIKVDNQLLNESRQIQKIKQVNDFFVNFTKFVLGLQFDKDELLFQETMQRLSNFCQSIDVFDLDKVKQLNKSIIITLINDQYIDVNQKIANVQSLLEEIKKKMEI